MYHPLITSVNRKEEITCSCQCARLASVSTQESNEKEQSYSENSQKLFISHTITVFLTGISEGVVVVVCVWGGGGGVCVWGGGGGGGQV